MTARKSERLLNLLITLLVSRTYVTKERLREVVEPYREAGDEAFEKMFERDKEELRSLGIPIEVGYVDRAFEDEPGYRIERSAFELPEIDLGARGGGGDRARGPGLAARRAGRRDLRRAGQAEGRRGRPSTAPRSTSCSPQLTAEEPAFEPLWDATRTRTPVRFGYRTLLGRRSRRPGTCSPGAWCPTAAAGTSSATTPTAASPGSSGSPGCRATSAPTARAGSFEVPPGTDLRALTALAGPAAGRPHRPGAGPPRRRARPAPARPSARADGADVPDGLGAARGDVRRDRRVRRRGAGVRRRRGRAERAAGRARVRRTTAARGRGRGGGRASMSRRTRPGRPGCWRWCPTSRPAARSSLEQAAADFGVQPGADRQGPQRAVVLRDARPRHGRPDRRGHGRARGRGRDPAVQRGLPHPPAAAGQLGGVRADRGAAGAARGRRRRRAPDRRPHAGQAGGRGRRRRAPWRPRWTSGCPSRRGRLAELRDRLSAGGRRSAGRCGWTTTCRPATSPPSGSSTRCGWSPPTGNTYLDGLVPPRRGPAAVPARPDLHAPRCSTRPSTQHADLRAPRPRRRDLPARRPTTCWSPCGSAPRPAGWRSTTRSRPAREAARRRPDASRCGSGTPPG